MGERLVQAAALPEQIGSDSAAVHAAVVASSLDAVIVVDEAGRVVEYNAAAEATFGYSAGEALGKSIGDLIVPDHLAAAHEAGMARYRATRQPHVLGRRVEMEARRKDGVHIPVELAITEVRLPDRRLFTASLRDLSAARLAAAEIERQRAALHQNEKLAALGSLLAGVAHELNNPLSIVLGQAILMREDVAEGAPAHSLEERAALIEAAAERCARVVRSFLAIARQRKPERSTLAAAAAVDAALAIQAYAIRSRGILVSRDDGVDVPNALADADQVQQILANLIVNAVQALEDHSGQRQIAIGIAQVGETVRITVADSGPGIAGEAADRLFDPFFTTKPAGTGIGLSVSRGLAEAMGGRLEAASSGLGGAAFILTLPAAGAEASGGEPAQHAAARPSAGIRALVVDDEPEIAFLVAETLGKAGFRCDMASGGREAQALVAAAGGRYGAIICDLRMPDLDGPAFFAWLTDHHPALAGRTLFVTGDALGPGTGAFLAASGRPVLEKPFAPADIVRLVATFAAS